MYNLIEYLVDSFNRLFKSDNEFLCNPINLEYKLIDDEQDEFLSEWLNVCEWLKPA